MDQRGTTFSPGFNKRFFRSVSSWAPVHHVTLWLQFDHNKSCLYSLTQDIKGKNPSNINQFHPNQEIKSNICVDIDEEKPGVCRWLVSESERRYTLYLVPLYWYHCGGIQNNNGPFIHQTASCAPSETAGNKQSGRCR